MVYRFFKLNILIWINNLNLLSFNMYELTGPENIITKLILLFNFAHRNAVVFKDIICSTLFYIANQELLGYTFYRLPPL
mgnify:CR=1 FL=1